MIRYRLTPEDVARVRFVADPAWNVCSSLSALVFSSSRNFHRELAQALDRQDLPALQFLRDVASDPRAPAVSLLPHDAEDVPGGASDTENRLRQAIRAIPDADLAGDLAWLREAKQNNRDLTVDQLRSRTADALVEYWSTVLGPFWDVAQAIAAQDLAKRATAIMQRGLSEVINSLSPKVRFTGSTLELEHPMDLDQPLNGGDVLLVPVAFHCPGGFIMYGPDGTDPPGTPLCVAYSATGIARLWENRTQEPESLTRLLGTTRARVLAATDLAASTSTIARRLDLPTPTVSGHLTILADAGFLDRMRRGRYVYYQISSAGRALMTAGEDRG